MSVITNLVSMAFDMYILIVILQVAVSWLINFDLINIANEKARNLVNLLRKATDPAYKPLQKYVPPIGGIDITPMIVIVGLTILKGLILGILI